MCNLVALSAVVISSLTLHKEKFSRSSLFRIRKAKPGLFILFKIFKSWCSAPLKLSQDAKPNTEAPKMSSWTFLTKIYSGIFVKVIKAAKENAIFQTNKYSENLYSFVSRTVVYSLASYNISLPYCISETLYETLHINICCFVPATKTRERSHIENIWHAKHVLWISHYQNLRHLSDFRSKQITISISGKWESIAGSQKLCNSYSSWVKKKIVCEWSNWLLENWSQSMVPFCVNKCAQFGSLRRKCYLLNHSLIQ